MDSNEAKTRSVAPNPRKSSTRNNNKAPQSQRPAHSGNTPNNNNNNNMTGRNSNGGNDEESVVNKKEEISRLMREIEEMEECIEQWRRTSGMHTILKSLEEKSDQPLDINDMTLTMSKGIEEGSKEAVTGILETAVIAALFLSFCIPILVDPPDAIAELENSDWKKILHLYGWGLMSALGAAIIMYARIYTTAVSRAVRASDLFRIQLAGNAFNESLIMVYGMFFFFTTAILADAVAHYGTAHGIGITLMTGSLILLTAYKANLFIIAGHIQYGWRYHRNSRDDPVDDKILFQALQKKMEVAEYLKDNAESIFKFKRSQRSTRAQGMTKEGKELFGLSN